MCWEPTPRRCRQSTGLDSRGFSRDQLEEVFIYKQSIDYATYERHRDRLQEELTIANLELNDARIESLDVEGVLGFALSYPSPDWNSADCGLGTASK
jgi:hypothetical protein